MEDTNPSTQLVPTAADVGDTENEREALTTLVVPSQPVLRGLDLRLPAHQAEMIERLEMMPGDDDRKTALDLFFDNLQGVMDNTFEFASL